VYAAAPGLLRSNSLPFIYFVLDLALALLMTLSMIIYHGTLGQRMAGLRTVYRSNRKDIQVKSALVRSLVFSGFVFCLGLPTPGPEGALLILLAYLWSAVDPRQQNLVDKVLGLEVVPVHEKSRRDG